jgi:hypothetical protein
MRSRILSATFLVSLLAAPATAAPLTFTLLSGVAGGNPAGTGVFKADLSSSGVASILSITITDGSFGLGGSPGQFSGFDLDAIAISTTDCATVACLSGATFLSVFDFTGGTFFTPGLQRAPADAKLFGTDATGTAVDNTVATLGLFDGNSTTALPPSVPSAFGFLSMGDGGVLSFDLLSAVSAAGAFLYIGEVGNNGEVAAGQITVSQQPTAVPEPASLLLIGTGALFARRAGRSRRTRA